MGLVNAKISEARVLDEAIHLGATRGLDAVTIPTVSAALSHRAPSVAYHWGNSEPVFYYSAIQRATERSLKDFQERIDPEEQDPVKLIYAAFQTALADRDDVLFLLADAYHHRQFGPDSFTIPSFVEEYVNRLLAIFDGYRQDDELYAHGRNCHFFDAIESIFLASVERYLQQIALEGQLPTRQDVALYWAGIVGFCHAFKDALIAQAQQKKLVRYGHAGAPLPEKEEGENKNPNK